MRKFMIAVNGKSYEVAVEEIKDGAAAPVMPVAAPVAVAPAAAPVAAPVAAPAAAPVAAAAPAGSDAIKAPMPGTILDVKVANGQAVKMGDVLFILEAMKMENEIQAPRAGTVTAVSAAKGSSVNSGDVLCAIQ